MARKSVGIVLLVLGLAAAAMADTTPVPEIDTGSGVMRSPWSLARCW
jgi:hypothetical protein